MITDEEFSLAWENKDNRLIMNSAIKRYSGLIPADEIVSCKMIGLWESMKSYDGKKGRKFTTYLYSGIQLQCMKTIRNELELKPIDDVVSYMDFNRIYIRDCVDKLEDDDKNLIYDRYFDMKTLKEISSEQGYSIETARRKINKALCKLEKILTK